MHKIMVVDDDKYILASMQRTLRKASNLQIEYFYDVKLALESASHQNYDLFVCDYQMPYIDGIEFFNRIHRLQPGSKRMLLSGNERSEFSEQSIDTADIHHFLTKPVDKPELISAIEQLLR